MSEDIKNKADSIKGEAEQIKAIAENIPRTADPLSPTTTVQEDVTKAGQRRINLIWESTQAVIAVSISWAVIYCAIKQIDATVLTNAFFLIVSIYFIRSNHDKIGGVGSKPLIQQRGFFKF